MTDEPRALGMAWAVHGVECPHDHTSYMVHDSVWRTEAGLGSNDVMCINCLQKRIGRKLIAEDFFYVPPG